MSEPVLRKRVLLDPEGHYELQVIEDDERRWLRLSTVLDAVHFFAIWSQPVLTRDGESTEHIAEQLRGRLANTNTNIDDAAEIWPRGWEFWGRAIPSPLRAYLVGGAFERDLRRTEPQPLP